MLNTSFPPWPLFTQEEADAVSRVLLSNKVNYWTGQECREFEKEFAEWAGSRHAIALTNGTAALELALEALEIGIGDEVIVPSYTFLASASAVVMRGAVPVIADVDSNSMTLTSESIAARITSKTKAVIPVHLVGYPCDMDPIMYLVKQHGLKVVEDCAQAHGAKYKGRSVGTIGHIGAWSFCQDKIMTTGGEGGMVTTSDKALWSRMWAYKDHGKSWDAVYNRSHQPGFRWLHDSFGTNFRMTEMQAVLGRIQLTRMADWTAKRQKNASAIWNAAASIKGLKVPFIPLWVEHAAYKCYVFVEPSMLKEGWNRDRIMDEINARGVPCYTGVCPEIYLEKAFDNTGWRPAERLPVARELGEQALMFLVHPTLRQEDIDRTCTVMREVMSMCVTK
ncbi:MAG: DegT/DnrJ/EryC1/StrS aminotransferase family protein [Chlorobiaceae bacterium]|nr:DegT/DnrJ/EryC1/StrS aminotransferase family protein [Chlorobiaceae bacterium]